MNVDGAYDRNEISVDTYRRVTGFDVEVVVPAYLGWRNAEADKESLRLYATDDGNAPRWDERYPAGRVAEVGIRERLSAGEGDRFLIVRVGDRFTPDDVMEAVAEAAQAAIRAVSP